MSHESGEGSGIEVECPDCHGSVAYEDVIAVHDEPGVACCPLCGAVSDVDEWFE